MVKVKMVKQILWKPWKACSGSRGIDPPILNLRIRWKLVFNFTSCPVYHPRFTKELGGPQSRSGLFWAEKILWFCRELNFVFSSSQSSQYYYFLSLCSPARAPLSPGFRDHAQRRTTIGRPPLDEWSALRRDLYLTTHTHNKHSCPGGIRTHDRSRRAAVDLGLRPRGHWDRQSSQYTDYKIPAPFLSWT
jgi:hypothetical protein